MLLNVVHENLAGVQTKGYIGPGENGMKRPLDRHMGTYSDLMTPSQRGQYKLGYFRSPS